MEILLTGATGYLGGELIKKLDNEGHKIRLIMRPNANLNTSLKKYEILTYKNEEDVYKYVKNINPQLVIHLAGSYGRDNETYAQICDANINLGLILIRALAECKNYPTFINAGTALESKVSFYALTKKQFKESAIYIANEIGNKYKFIDMQIQHFYGPNNNDKNFITYVLQACIKNQNILNLTKGEQLRDFIYIDDLVDAFICVVNNHLKMKEITNLEVGSGKQISIKEIVDIIHSMTKSKTQIDFGSK